MAEQNAPGVTEDMVTRASHVLWTEVNPEYQADISDFTDADIAAGKLREADDADTAQNRAIVRRVLEAAFPDAWLSDDVRELLTDLRRPNAGVAAGRGPAVRVHRPAGAALPADGARPRRDRRLARRGADRPDRPRRAPARRDPAHPPGGHR